MYFVTEASESHSYLYKLFLFFSLKPFLLVKRENASDVVTCGLVAQKPASGIFLDCQSLHLCLNLLPTLLRVLNYWCALEVSVLVDVSGLGFYSRNYWYLCWVCGSCYPFSLCEGPTHVRLYLICKRHIVTWLMITYLHIS